MKSIREIWERVKSRFSPKTDIERASLELRWIRGRHQVGQIFDFMDWLYFKHIEALESAEATQTVGYLREAAWWARLIDKIESSTSEQIEIDQYNLEALKKKQ